MKMREGVKITKASVLLLAFIHITVPPVSSTTDAGWVEGCAVATCTCGSSLRVTDEWNENVKGEFKIPVTIPTTSWSLTLRFSVPVLRLQIWNAIEVSKSLDDTTYYLRNPDYHGDLTAGDQLAMEFIATYQGTERPVWDTLLSQQDVCGEPPETTTTAEVTAEDYQCTCDSRVEIVDEWPGHVKARVIIPLTNPVTSGWRLFLQFSDPVLNVQSPNAQNKRMDNGFVYRLKNYGYNANVLDQLVQEFIVVFNNDAPQPRIYPRLNNQPQCVCSDNVPTTEGPATTDDIVSTTTIVPSTTDAGWVEGCAVATCTCGSSLRVTGEWNENVKGEFRIPVTIPTTSWSLTLRFSVPVLRLQIWNAIEVSKSLDDTTYYLRNPDYHGDLMAEDQLAMEFIVTYQGAERPVWDALLSQQDVCGEPPETTTTLQPVSSTDDPATLSTTTKATTSESATTKATTSESATTKPTTSESATTSPATSQPSSTEYPPTQGPVIVPGMPYAYYEVLNKSIQFYEAQRSGDLPEERMRVSWRKDSTLNDGSDVGLDLTGGWFDAGDYVKFGFPMAQTATTLAWGALQYREAYEAAGQMEWMLDCLKWATDYFLKCHSAENELYAQVGDGNADHSYWGRPEDMDIPRPSMKVDASSGKHGSDVAGETAAALAASSVVFRDTDPAYADVLLIHAKELYSFANNYRGIYSQSIPNAAQFYGSSGYGDELAWAAAWLSVATLRQGSEEERDYYLAEAEAHYQSFGLGDKAWAYSWDDKKAGVQLLLYNITRNAQYAVAIQNTLDDWLPGGAISHTPKGLAYRDQWGVNRYAANMAFLSLVAADNMLNSATYRQFASSQIDYMLGDGGRSYVVGFGTNPPHSPHHRSSSCPNSPGTCDWSAATAPGPNPQVLHGALVGGPTSNDEFVNNREDYIYNEVATDYNAGFQSAVAGIYKLYVDGTLN